MIQIKVVNWIHSRRDTTFLPSMGGRPRGFLTLPLETDFFFEAVGFFGASAFLFCTLIGFGCPSRAKINWWIVKKKQKKILSNRPILSRPNLQYSDLHQTNLPIAQMEVDLYFPHYQWQ